MTRGLFATAVLTLAFAAPCYALDGQRGNSAAAHTQHGGSTPHGNQTTHGGSEAHGGSTTTTAKTTTTVTTHTTLSPVQQKVSTHTQLASKLQSRLPAGTNVVTAASGFRNLGQFVAAVNVSHNLGIPFASLKNDMVTRHMSLGQSIQDLRPSANATREAQHAESEAETEIETESHTATSTKTRTGRK